MAKIYSHSESRAKGSVGMTTYRYSRGKVIQSQKVAPWDSSVDAVGNATRWNARTALLGIISLWCSVHSESIKHSFNRAKGGSARNYFMHKNYKALAAAFSSLAEEYAFTRTAPAIQAIEDAMGAYAAAHANTILRVKKTGYAPVFLSGNWDDADDPIAAVLVSDITAVLDQDYNLTQVAIVGENLAGELRVKLGGADISGVMSVGADKKSALFTPSNIVLVKGTKSLAVTIGSRVLYTEDIEGDPRTYYTLALGVTPAGGGSVSGAGEYPAGTEVPVSATPATGFSFVSWSDDNTSPSRTIVLNENVTLTATFMRPSDRAQVNFPAGGSVTVGGSAVVSGSVVDVPVGSNVAIRYTPASGKEMDSMTISPSDGRLSFAADSAQAMSSNAQSVLYARQYNAAQYTITITDVDES